MSSRVELGSRVRVRVLLGRRVAGILLCVGVLFGGGCVFGCVGAFAGSARRLVGSFGAGGSGVVDPVPLTEPAGVTVDQATGDVFVADKGGHRVQKFSASGEFLLEFGGNVNKNPVALDRDVCRALESSECQAGTSGSAPEEFESPQFVAVDEDSSSPSFGDVYVADTGDDAVSKFTPEGELVAAWGTGGQLFGPRATGKGTLTANTHTVTEVTTESGEFKVGEVLLGVGVKPETAITEVNPGVLRVDNELEGSGVVALSGVTSLAGIAVGSTGTLYVMSSPGAKEGCTQESQLLCRVFEFTPTGAPSGEVELKTNEVKPVGLAVDASGDIFKASDGSIEELTAAGEGLVQIASGGVGAFAREPASGDLYAVAGDSVERFVLNGSGQVVQPGGGLCTPAPTEGCGPSDLSAIGYAGAGIGVVSRSGDTGDVLVSNPEGEVDVFSQALTVADVTTGSASEQTGTGVTLSGMVSPDGVVLSSCEFEYVPPGQFEDSEFTDVTASEKVGCEPAAGAISTTGETEVHAKLKGLTPGVTYHYRLVAGNENGESVGSSMEVSTLPAPSIDAAAVRNLSGESADLTAEINPNGSASTYWFEYGESVGYGTRVPVPDGSVGEDSVDVAVSVHVSGLVAGRAYHWRVVATNENGTTIGLDHVFVYPQTGVGLPDGRAYEMVTPEHKNGALIGDVFIGGVPDIAADGQRVIAESAQCFADAQSCNGQLADSVGSPYAFTRTGSGWATTALAPAVGVLSRASFWGASALAGTALFSAPTEPFGEDDFYAREPDGTFMDLGPVTPPEGGEQGAAGGGSPAARPELVSENLSRVVWQTEKDQLGRWPFDETESLRSTLYEYAGGGGGQPFLVGVSEGQGSTDLVSRCGAAVAGLFGGHPGRMSAGGETVFFSVVGNPGCVGSGLNGGVAVPVEFEVFARVDGESADAHTVAISEPGADEAGLSVVQAECVSHGCVEDTSAVDATRNWRTGFFVGASADGSVAYFTSEQRLTDQAVEGSARATDCSVAGSACNLYVSVCVSGCGSAGEVRRVVDVSAGDLSGRGPRVQGVLAVSEDGSHVYFVAKGVLSGVANGRGEVAVDGADNLYVYERDATYPAGHVAFITDMPASDEPEWFEGEPANVTPDGQFLVFLSHGDLTGDDTSGSGGGWQVFRYDAVSETLNRVSIGEGGFDDDGNANDGENAVLAFNIFEFGDLRRDPSMSDDGSRVFFQSPVALTSKALAGVENVYEWEREGVGSCPAGQSSGCVFLISDGQDATRSAGDPRCEFSAVCLLGVDTTGNNVFFSTADGLVAGDTDGELDYYDARVCEPQNGNPCITEPAEPPAGCREEACHGVPAGEGSPPIAPSVSFDGQGNVVAPVVAVKHVVVLSNAEKLVRALRACRKKRDSKKRLVCERAARKAYAPKARARKAKSALKGRNHGSAAHRVGGAR